MKRSKVAICAAIVLALLISATIAHGATGDLQQKPPTAGCVAATTIGGSCVVGFPITSPTGVAVSPDRRSVYVVAGSSDAVLIFDRDQGTGELTQKVAPAGCVGETDAGGNCQDGVALDGAFAVAVSPDGRSVYVASPGSDAVAIFDRDTSGGSTHGALTQKAPDPAGCVSETGTAGACQDGLALDGADGVAVSPDGESVYVTAQDALNANDAVAIFDRDTSGGSTHGALAQKTPAPAGCVSETGTTGSCQDGVALDGAFAVDVSSDGRSVYVASLTSSAVVVLDRDTSGGAAHGALIQKPSLAGCISSGGTGGLCQSGDGLIGARGVAVTADGKSVYIASAQSDALAILDRDADGGATHGELTQEAGAVPCISETGAGACDDGVALDGAAGIAASPDGTSVYLASSASNAVAIFDREPLPLLTVDNAPPETTITGAPKSKVKTKKKRSKATFSFTSSETGSTFECSLDGDPFQACTSPAQVKVRKGTHTFSVRATDAAGNADSTPASRTWKVRKKQGKRPGR